MYLCHPAHTALHDKGHDCALTKIDHQDVSALTSYNYWQTPRNLRLESYTLSLIRCLLVQLAKAMAGYSRLFTEDVARRANKPISIYIHLFFPTGLATPRSPHIQESSTTAGCSTKTSLHSPKGPGSELRQKLNILPNQEKFFLVCIGFLRFSASFYTDSHRKILFSRIPTEFYLSFVRNHRNFL